MAIKSITLKRVTAVNVFDTLYPVADYNTLINKPATFTPAPHTHPDYLGINDKADDSELLDGINGSGYVRRYIGDVANVSSAGYTHVAQITDSELGAVLKIHVGGTTGSVVLATTALIITNHSQDIYIRSESGEYTDITLKVVTSGDGDFSVYVKTTSATAVTLKVEIEMYRGGSVWITATDPGHTLSTLEHICSGHGLVISAFDNGVDDSFIRVNGNNVILEGDARLSDSREASDVYAWAKTVSKPSYNLSELGEDTTHRTVTDAEKTTWNDDINTWRGIDDIPVNGELAESISSNWAFDHITVHAPSDAEAHIAPTKVEIEAVLTGAISTHTHNYNNYVHPTHPGDDMSVGSGALSGSAVLTSLTFNVNSDTEGHVLDANATVSTKNIDAIRGQQGADIKFWHGLQTAYDALTPSASVLYFITEPV